MEGYLRKYGWAIQLSLIIIIAAMLAVIASEIVGIYLAPYRVPNVDLSARKAQEGPKTPQQKTSSTVMAQVINERCLFDGCPEVKVEVRECNPPCEDGEICSDGTCIKDPNEAVVQGDVPVESTSGIKLLGVMVASNPRYSTAILKSPAATVSSVVGIGDSIDGAEIKEIYRDRIIFAKGGRLEFIRLDDSLQGNPSAGRTIASAREREDRAREERAQEERRRREREEEARAKKDADSGDGPPIGAAPESADDAPAGKGRPVELSRREINQALRNPAELAKNATVLPHYENGRPAGVKLSGVGGVFSKLGIQSGDVLKRVNGQRITSQASAFQAFSQLKNSKSVGIEVDRGGKTETLNYTIK